MAIKQVPKALSECESRATEVVAIGGVKGRVDSTAHQGDERPAFCAKRAPFNIGISAISRLGSVRGLRLLKRQSVRFTRASKRWFGSQGRVTHLHVPHAAQPPLHLIALLAAAA